MKILLLTDGIAPIVMGGMQKHSRLLAEHLATDGHHVTLFHYSIVKVADNAVKSHFSEGALSNISFRHFLYRDNNVMPGHYLRAQKRMSEQYLIELLKMEPFDFIYAKGFMSWALLHKREAYGIKTPVGVKFHGMNMFQSQPDLKGEVAKYLLRRPVIKIMNQSDYVFSYGGKITEIIAKEIEDPSKIIELPSGISSDWIRNEDQIQITKKQVKFLFVGRFDRLKGIPEMNKALEKFELDLGWSLTHVGPIPKNQKSELLQIKYLGSISDELHMRDIYDKHDVLICPSISEGMPNVIMEAMARGLAVIATDVGASNVLVKENNGWLIKPQSVSEIEKALILALSIDEKELALMKCVSIDRMKQDFLWEGIALKFIDWLKNVS